MLIYNELPTSFPWYDKIEKQHNCRENVNISKTYNLISPQDALLPFEILIDTGAVLLATEWHILDMNGNLVADISRNIPLLKGRTVDAGTYIFYNGEQLSITVGSGSQPLSLSTGGYYSRIMFGGVLPFYSELFRVPLNKFSVNDPDTAVNYMKISYSNGCDIAPILYAGNNGEVFTQVMYLDTFVHTSEPEVEQDGEQDGNNRDIDSYQRMIVSYRFSLIVPDFLKIAITSLQLHTVVNVVTAKGVRKGTIDSMTISSTVEDNGAYSKVDVKFEQTMMVKHGCCDFMALSNVNLPVNILDPTFIKPGFLLPDTTNSSIISDINWTLALIPVTPGVRYYIYNWNTVRGELGFYGPGTPTSPTALPVINSGPKTKISGMPGAYTTIAPVGSAYMAFTIKSDEELPAIYTPLQVWAANPGKPYMIKAQTFTATTTNITAGIPAGSWGNVYTSATQGGVYSLVISSLTPQQLISGIVVAGNLGWWKVEALNYNTNYGITPPIPRVS
jgi:hypothetical protein